MRGRLAAGAGQPEAADTEFARAIELFASFSASFWAACGRVEWAELLVARGDSSGAAALAAPAAATLSSLGAAPWLTRVRALVPSLEVAS